MRGVIVKMPNPLGTRHHVEVIGFVSVRDHDRMVSSRNQHDVAILHRHGLIQIARVTVDALKDKALRRIDAMIVGFFELALKGNVVDVVFVRRIARGVSAGSSDLRERDYPPVPPFLVATAAATMLVRDFSTSGQPRVFRPQSGFTQTCCLGRT